MNTKSLNIFLKHFPCIIASLRDYSNIIPLDKDIFDLVVIDEASQVNIAQAFPTLIRGKKILVLGDRKQFSNIKSSMAAKDVNSEYIAKIGPHLYDLPTGKLISVLKMNLKYIMKNLKYLI